MSGGIEVYTFGLRPSREFLHEQVSVVFIDGVLNGVTIHVLNTSLNIHSWEADDEAFNMVLDLAEKLVKKRGLRVTYSYQRTEYREW